ncbi:Uncharacterized protein OS=Pseudomonas stutzeri MF28 GN=L686_22480 PE=4 SV=1 [Gemmata massiliana]|uniref:Uncharacterized protein n=1 Tax=Gemmata massiliana TaxID=1210884 RepID=A0A6P2DJB4_9BACT|nr:hypothetical protein [Gemmata massiliana]VTS02475.1 Uncharacterized protein OS=Pseudomonas stutzeri MF28 GN=L686_22480 PE=4 SV=1 [Gemmata massiliana]
MSLNTWIGLFLLTSLFWAWLLFLGGARWLEGSWLIAFIVDFSAMEWTADGIRLFAMLMWILETIWFVIGLFVPEVRFWP